MSQRTASVIAVIVAFATWALLAAAWVLAYLNGQFSLFNYYGPDLFIPIGIVGVGAIVAGRRPANPIGWLFLVCGLLDAARAAAAEYAIRGLTRTPGLPAVGWAAWLTNWILYLIFPTGVLLFIVLLFPNGRLLT